MEFYLEIQFIFWHFPNGPETQIRECDIFVSPLISVEFEFKMNQVIFPCISNRREICRVMIFNNSIESLYAVFKILFSSPVSLERVLSCLIFICQKVEQIITDHVRSTRAGNVITGVCPWGKRRSTLGLSHPHPQTSNCWPTPPPEQDCSPCPPPLEPTTVDPLLHPDQQLLTHSSLQTSNC